MTTYMVERNLAGISMEALAGARAAAIATAEGTDVTYLRTMFAPEGGSCFCMFDGPSADAVKAINDKAGLPYSRVVEALYIPAP
jgi:hypothetical protein